MGDSYIAPHAPIIRMTLCMAIRSYQRNKPSFSHKYGMKFRDLKEYNKGAAGEPFNSQTLDKLRARAEFITHFFRDQIQIKIFQVTHLPDVYFLLERREQIIGYFWCRQIEDNILQVKFSYIFPKFHNQGLGTEAYVHLIHLVGKRLIHDTQLSHQAEQIWKNKLPQLGLVRGIWDRRLNVTYGNNQVGNLTADNEIILDPSQDHSDPFIDYDGDTQRFFWITENKHGSKLHTVLESHKLYHLMGADQLWNEDPVVYHRANRSIQVLIDPTGL